MQQALIILSSIVVFISYCIYEWSIIAGRTKPYRTTRFVLFAVTALGAISLWAAHDRVAVWLIGVYSLQSLVVFLLSIKYGVGGWRKFDLFCLALAIIGVILWQTTDNPVLALYLSIAADLTGRIPAYVKTYKLSNSEYFLPYILDSIAAALTLLAIRVWLPASFAYPAYIAAANIAMLGLIFKPRKLVSALPETAK